MQTHPLHACMYMSCPGDLSEAGQVAKIQLLLHGHDASAKAMADLLAAKASMDGKWCAAWLHFQSMHS